MPMFKISHMKFEEVNDLAHGLTSSLASILDCPNDWIYFTNINSDSRLICASKPCHDTVFIYVEWFDRGQEIKDKIAKIITEEIKQHHPTKDFITVIFKNLEPNDYFENGIHY